jgi:hypothetical protein
MPRPPRAARDEDDGTIWTAADLLTAFGDAVADACARARVAPRPGPAPRGSLGARVATALSGADPVVELHADDGAEPRPVPAGATGRTASAGRGGPTASAAET